MANKHRLGKAQLRILEFAAERRTWVEVSPSWADRLVREGFLAESERGFHITPKGENFLQDRRWKNGEDIRVFPTRLRQQAKRPHRISRMPVHSTNASVHKNNSRQRMREYMEKGEGYER